MGYLETRRKENHCSQNGIQARFIILIIQGLNNGKKTFVAFFNLIIYFFAISPLNTLNSRQIP